MRTNLFIFFSILTILISLWAYNIQQASKKEYITKEPKVNLYTPMISISQEYTPHKTRALIKHKN